MILVDGVPIHIEQAGAGPPLLLVHGLIGSARNWEQNIPAWAEIRTVSAIDQVNLGKSARAAGIDASLEAHADRIAALLDVLGLDSADIAGHSHGGAIVMMLALRHPERVRRLILFAPANPFCKLGRSLLWFYSTLPGKLLARQITRMPRFIHDLAHKRMYVDRSKATPSALEGYTVGMNPQTMDHVLGIVRTWWPDMAKLRDGLPRLKQFKTLLIWGDRDPAVGVASGHQLAQAIGAKLIVLERTGHIPFQEKPKECNAAVLEWLS